MEKKTFRSRVSILLILFIAAVFSCSAAVVISYGDSDAIIRTVGLFILLFAFIIALFFSMNYRIDGQILYIRYLGFSAGSIELQDICKIKRTYNPLSSPAASLKRMALYRRKSTGKPVLCALISPVREEEFLDMLKSVNPSIDIQVNNRKSVWRIWDWDL